MLKSENNVELIAKELIKLIHCLYKQSILSFNWTTGHYFIKKLELKNLFLLFTYSKKS